MNIRVWEGEKGSKKSEFEFCGEELGWVREGAETHIKETTVYRTVDGQYVVHEVRYPRAQDEEPRAAFFVFPSLGKARERFGWVLQRVGIHPSPKANLFPSEGWGEERD